MFFSKKVKKSFEVMQERNRRYLESMKEKEAGKASGDAEEASAPDGAEELPAPGTAEEAPEEELRAEREEKREEAEETLIPAEVLPEEDDDEIPGKKENLEKGDLPAMIISAFLVFGPVFLILGGILALAWIFLH
ncbi:MAG: hypothetical protein J5849_01980 [Clostridia bacterium]|nr:hypothetical protein [Clostridia bacterium]